MKRKILLIILLLIAFALLAFSPCLALDSNTNNDNRVKVNIAYLVSFEGRRITTNSSGCSQDTFREYGVHVYQF